MKINSKNKKGFTLMELVIVIAIIGILAAVLVPAWGAIIAKSRIKSQNNNSRIIFNSAQRECIELKRRDRTIQNEIRRQQEIINSPTQDATAKAQALINLQNAMDKKYITDDFYFYYDGKNGYACNSSCDDIGANAEMNKEFTDAVNRGIETSDKTIYKIHIKDYKVVSVASSRFEGDKSLGTYPVVRDKKSSSGIKGFDMSEAEKTYDSEETE